MIPGRHGLIALVAALVLALAAPVRAQTAQQPCRLSLLLAIDVSASVDASEYILQRDGLASALLLPEIRQALLHGGGPVALSVYEWSGRQRQSIVLPWTLMTSEAAILGAAETISTARRSETGFPTAAGYALGFGAVEMTRAPTCGRRVIDISGDGVNNEGFGPDLAYANFPFEGVVVNGLAILGSDAGVLEFYRDSILHGPGAFLETADGFEDFERAMGYKLFRELNDIRVGESQAPDSCCG